MLRLIALRVSTIDAFARLEMVSKSIKLWLRASEVLVVLSSCIQLIRHMRLDAAPILRLSSAIL